MLGLAQISIPCSATSKESSASKKKDWFDKIDKYLSSTDGVANFLETIINATQYVQLLPIKENRKLFFRRVQTVSETGWSMLTFPALPSDFNRFRKSLGLLKNSYSQDTTSAAKKEALKQAFVDGNYLAYSSTEGLTFLHDAKVVNLGRGYPIANGVYYATSLIGDGVDIWDEAKKIKALDALDKKVRSPKDAEIIHENQLLSKWKLAKSIVSVALTVIGLLSFAFGMFNGGVLFPLIGLVCSTAYVTLKISNYFYEKSLKEKGYIKLPQPPINFQSL